MPIKGRFLAVHSVGVARGTRIHIAVDFYGTRDSEFTQHPQPVPPCLECFGDWLCIVGIALHCIGHWALVLAIENTLEVRSHLSHSGISGINGPVRALPMKVGVIAVAHSFGNMFHSQG